MGLLQKKPQFGDSIPYYTLGNTKTVLIIGLGNIGADYDNTRHNIGFAAIDQFASSQGLGQWSEKKDLKCLLSSGQLGRTKVIAVKPTTFMNNSGEAVQAVAHFYKVQPDNILVIHDELDIPFGQIRTRIGGGSAGHNGIKSVSQHIGEQYGRIRIGIGPKQPAMIDSADFVLGRFTGEQQSSLSLLCKETAAIISEYVYSGTDLFAETRQVIAEND